MREEGELLMPMREKVYFTPTLRGLEHITPQSMKMDFLPPELSKTRQITH
jgi:hypothetical protein